MLQENSGLLLDTSLVFMKLTLDLCRVHLEIPTGSLVAVVGNVGNGKSSLLSAILGEMEKTSGFINTSVGFSIYFCIVNLETTEATWSDPPGIKLICEKF